MKKCQRVHLSRKAIAWVSSEIFGFAEINPGGYPGARIQNNVFAFGSIRNTNFAGATRRAISGAAGVPPLRECCLSSSDFWLLTSLVHLCDPL